MAASVRRFLMTLMAVPKRPAVAARRTGYVVAVLVNAAILYGANVWPGWRALPFLTEDMSAVMGLVNASLVVSLVANIVYALADPRWLKALGDVLTTTVGLAALVQLWQVFPFDFGGSSFDWTLVVRILVGVGIVGSAIAIVVAFVSFLKSIHRAAP
jgi:hypothetical protein